MNFSKKLFFLIGILSILIGCKKKDASAKKEVSTISVTDYTGNVLSLSQPAQRVVVLFDSGLEAMYMLEASDRIVGVPVETYYDKELYQYYSTLDDKIKNKSIATPGSKKAANIESIVALNPDLVITSNNAENFTQNLKKIGIPVYNMKSETYEDILKEVADLGIVLGKRDRSVILLNYIKKELDHLDAIPKEGGAFKKAYFAWANGRIFTTSGTKSMMDKCLKLAGVENVCTAPLDQTNISPETLVKWNPDIIIIWNDKPELFYQQNQLQSVAAVKNKTIYQLDPMFFYNPHTLKSLLAAKKIHYWAYLKDRVPIEELNGDMKNMLMVLYGKNFNEQLAIQMNKT